MNAGSSGFRVFQAQPQFRMCRLQVFNWGTFDKLHTVPISEKGFLFVGRSGSGKTTLLDAISTLIVPPRWVNFNAAAQENDRRSRDRNLATYVRGAWAEQKDYDSGEVAMQFLRGKTTWSAIALTFRHTDGRVVTLVRMFWIRGTSSNARDVKQHFMVFERAFDLQELSNFDMDLRRLKHEIHDGHHFDQFNSYCERFRRLLEINDELALRLLHKTQSAKNLGDLNVFLRDFMLELPPTFDVADRLVSEFGELNDAHQSVVTAREQIQVLKPAQRDHERWEVVEVERARLEKLRTVLDSYRDERRETLLDERITKLQATVEALTAEIRAQEHNLNNQRDAQRNLEERHRELGGDRIESLKRERDDLTERRGDRVRKRSQAQVACQQLGWRVPTTVSEFAETISLARQELNDWQSQRDALREEQVELSSQKRDAEKQFSETVREVDAMKRQPSNIPSDMLELRSRIAVALGLTESALPFVGELIDVQDGEESWRGAIERVLRGFALSILVQEQSYSALSNYLNQVNLGTRLVYYRTRQPASEWEVKSPLDSLIHKLKLKDGAQVSWLRSELAKRYDYACVDSMQEFRNRERALTREGQIKHNSARHEKDDRRSVGDSRHWVLGFDNREKRSRFEKLAQDLAETIAQIIKKINLSADEEKRRAGRAMSCQTLANLEWHEIDVAPLEDRIKAIGEMLDEIRIQNSALRDLDYQLEMQSAFIKELEDELQKKHVTSEKTKGDLGEFRRQLNQLRGATGSTVLTDDQREDLNARFGTLNQVTTLENLDRQMSLVKDALFDEIRSKEQERNQLVRAVEERYAEFKRRWPMEGSDVDATLASASEFIAKLNRLESDGLPKYEKRFFELLQTQSHQNLAALNTYLLQALRDIRDRMQVVNDGLRQAEFNKHTYLRIEVIDHQLPEVRDFKQNVKQVLSHTFGDDRQLAEERFLVLRQLVERLKGTETEDKRWRETVLDVRLHVEFIGREFDADEREVEVYRSGAGKSGGQRQKLATTCLAAALRYQLGGADHEVPVYAPVVLDEAFDKADNEFTQLAMRIFENFGFQMVVATPLKSVMTLEPFIGGACFVDITDRQRSTVLLIEYDDQRQRLNLPAQSNAETSIAASE